VVNIAFVADKSEAYVAFERDRLIKEWGFEWDGTRNIQKIAEAGAASLFGEAPLSILTLEDKDQVKETADKIKNASVEELARWAKPGIIILTSVDRTSTKTIEKLVAEKNGVVVLAKESSKDKKSPAERLVNDLHLNYEAKTFLKEFAGDNYSSILSLLKTLGDLKPEQQKNITVDDLIVRLPQAPGAIPPWEIEPAILRGDTTKAIELYRRVAQTSHFLIVLSILKNKFHLVFRVAATLDSHPRYGLEQIAKALSVPNNYPLRLAYDAAKKMGPKQALQNLEIIASTEAKVKGGSAGDPHIAMESMLIRISSSTKR